VQIAPSSPEDAADPSTPVPDGLRPDGIKGFVELLPAPPEFEGQPPLASKVDIRFFELTPAPEN
jgi:hypothetical protein